MLIFLLTASLTWAAPNTARTKAVGNLTAGCLRSEVHTEADKRRAICDCIGRNMNQNKNISDADLAYLAKTWAEPHKKITPAPKEADILEDYDEELMERCTQEPGYNSPPKG